MPKWEFFGDLRRIFVSITETPCVSVDAAIDGRSQTETNMLDIYFAAPKMLMHLRTGPSGPYLDGFAVALDRQGYSADTAVRYLRAAAHLGHVVARGGTIPSDIDLTVFSEHLRSCRCPRALGGRRNHHTIFGARLFRQHLVEIGVCRSAASASQPAEPFLVADFKAWLRKHRGASDPTIKLYARDASLLVAALEDDPERWEPAAIRSFFMDRARQCGNRTVEKLTTSLRAFLRYLAVTGRSRAGLDEVVPGYARWRLADLPRYLSTEQVSRLIAACDGEVVTRQRDRAIVLILVRLGLRAGDVAQLRLDDIEWDTGSLRVSGKSRYEVRLPLPQDVGDAIAALRATSATVTPGIMLSAAIRARSAFVRRRRPLGPSITSSRETPTPIEPSKWTPILPSLSKSNTSAAHVRAGCWLQVKNGRRGSASRLPTSWMTMPRASRVNKRR